MDSNSQELIIKSRAIVLKMNHRRHLYGCSSKYTGSQAMNVSRLRTDTPNVATGIWKTTYV
jgi:hypothetical protein